MTNHVPNGVSVRGLQETLDALEKKLGPAKVVKVSKQALKLTGKYMETEIKKAVETYRDTGATVNELVVSTPRAKSGTVTVKVGWDGKGSDQRYRLVHLNEFGYTPHGIYANHANAVDSKGFAFYKPGGFGKIRQAYDAARQPSLELARAELRKLVD